MTGAVAVAALVAASCLAVRVWRLERNAYIVDTLLAGHLLNHERTYP